MYDMSVTLETCDDADAEVSRVARASVDRSERAEGRRRSTRAFEEKRGDAAAVTWIFRAPRLLATWKFLVEVDCRRGGITSDRRECRSLVI